MRGAQRCKNPVFESSVCEWGQHQLEYLHLGCNILIAPLIAVVRVYLPYDVLCGRCRPLALRPWSNLKWQRAPMCPSFTFASRPPGTTSIVLSSHFPLRAHYHHHPCSDMLCFNVSASPNGALIQLLCCNTILQAAFSPLQLLSVTQSSCVRTSRSSCSASSDSFASPRRALGLGRSASASGEAISPTILGITESWLQSPAGALRRATTDGNEGGGDQGSPGAARQLAEDAAQMLEHLLASPDKVQTVLCRKNHGWS